MITDAMVEAAAIADRYGIVADNDQQRLVRKRLYAEGKVCPDTSIEVPTEDCGTVLVRGKDHWRMVLEAAERAAWQPIDLQAILSFCELAIIVGYSDDRTKPECKELVRAATKLKADIIAEINRRTEG